VSLKNARTAGRHSMDSPEWYTPLAIVDAARRVMGGIDLDPASHPDANAHLHIPKIFTAEEDGLAHAWHGRVLLNPPGGKRDRQSLTGLFFRKLLEEYAAGRTTEALWIGYSLEQLQTLQMISTLTPDDFPSCHPRKRIAFIESDARKAARRTRSGPSHANYLTYLGPHVDAFAAAFEPFGKIIIPIQWADTLRALRRDWVRGRC
jgi:hypothetical protein